MARPKGIPAHNKQSIDEIKQRLFEAHGSIVSLDEKTYINTHTKCKFIDKDYGEWFAYPINVINKKSSHPKRNVHKSILALNSEKSHIKRQKTILEKYGVEHISKNKDIRNKQIKSLNTSYVLSHWQTNEEILCQGSWEKKVVEWLNKNKIDFDWQIPFNMPTGQVYFVDCFLKKENLYIEIKGKFWDEDSLNKWNWFHFKYENSQLWNRPVLRQKGIKVK